MPCIEDEKYMRRALELAAGGAGFVSPNPLVGAVIVKDGAVIAEGFHRRFGELHAETDAIRNADGKDISGATLYVNLEPCSHYGKQPPCTQAIIKSKIAKVVFGINDPNPLVGGRGERALIDAGIEVCKGVLQDECRKINRYFIKHITTKMPFVVLKVALSIDGSIACANGNAKWISSPESRKRVHYLRSVTDAVMVGKGTARNDNPQLTVRDVVGRNPKRIILDGRLSLPENLNVFCDDMRQSSYLLYSEGTAINDSAKKIADKGVNLAEIKTGENGQMSMVEILKYLGEKLNLNSVLIEGGAGVFTSIILQNLADEYYFYVCPRFLGNGIRFDYVASSEKVSDSAKIRFLGAEKIGDDIEIIGEKEKY